MATRSIQKGLKAFKVNMGGIILDQALPQRSIDQVDPFLLIHHLDHKHDGGQLQSEVGVPPHPHRGFAPVSFVFKGGIHHRDSLGKSSVVMGGGTQWMHSGRGIVHSERPTKETAKDGGTWELIQFWVNVPKNKKMTDPYYVPLHPEDTPKVKVENNLGEIGVVAGEYQGTKGKIKTESPQTLLRFELEAGASVSIPLPKSYNALLYILDGQVTVGDEVFGNRGIAIFNNDGDTIDFKVSATTRAILLSGEPIGEPVETYGPFVMNTREEIRTAISDYQSGKMGRLTENFEE